MKKNKERSGILILLLLTCFFSCSKMDEYKTKYMSGGAITYAGKMDSINILSGKYRVKLTGLFTSDPNIVKYRVFWNSRQDSTEASVTRTSNVDTANLIISGLEEGTQSFEIRTYDNAGNSSIPSYVTATAYGDNYQSSIVNRGIVDASFQSDSSALITWADVNTDAGILYMEILYTDKNSLQHDTTITSIATGQTSILPNIKLGSSFNYKTAYIPTTNAIDTFYVDYETHSVKADITNIYLSNIGSDFLGVLGSDGRFGTLNAPWITNEGAKNKGGNTYGGYQHASWQSTGVITWETWGNTPVVDGKIYQVTSSPLPAGNYTITFTDYSEIQQNSSVYIIVAAGNSGIPSISNIQNALGYAALYNGATIGQTTPNMTETKSFNFTLDSPQFVSIGILGNMIGSGDPGSYFELRSIILIQN